MDDHLHVVLGATGGAGRAIATALVERGFVTRTVNRSGAQVDSGAEAVAADIENGDDVVRAVAGASVVYMAAQPPYTDWPNRFPSMVSKVVDTAASIDAKVVMVDNLYGYGPVADPMSEATPEQATDRKGKVRRQMTEMLLDAHREGRVRVAIGRASDYFGPGCENSGVAALVIAPAAAGKSIRWIGRDDVPHSVAYLPDVARAYVTLGTSDEANGEIWHLPHAPAITGAEFLAAVNEVSGGGLRTGTVSKAMLRLASPFHGVSRETLGVLHQWDRPFVVDDTKFRSTFGSFEDTPLNDAIHASIEWHREAGNVPVGG